jgi:hypothetical protein
MPQQAGRTYRLGCLLPLTRDAPINAAFLEELRRRGFIEGQNFTVEYRAYGLHPDLISQYAAELVKARVDVIVTAGVDEAIRAAQQATKTIPIVAMSDDMIGSGLVGSMARPNGNTTGVSILAATLDGTGKMDLRVYRSSVFLRQKVLTQLFTPVPIAVPRSAADFACAGHDAEAHAAMQRYLSSNAPIRTIVQWQRFRLPTDVAFI